MKTKQLRLARTGLLLTWVWLGIAYGARAQAVNTTKRVLQTRASDSAAAGDVSPSPAPRHLTDRPEDEKAILALAAAYTRAFNSGDARSLAALYTEDAEI